MSQHKPLVETELLILWTESFKIKAKAALLRTTDYVYWIKEKNKVWKGWLDSTDGKTADCGVGGTRFKSWRGMIFSTNIWILILCWFDSVFHVQV